MYDIIPSRDVIVVRRKSDKAMEFFGLPMIVKKVRNVSVDLFDSLCGRDLPCIHHYSLIHWNGAACAR